MARVQLGSIGLGVLQNMEGTVQAGVTPTITDLSNNPVTVYAAATGATTTSPISDSKGALQGYVEEGTYQITVSGVTKIADAVSGAVHTVQILQSDVADPFGAITNITGPNTGQIGTSRIYNDSGSGNIFHLSSYVENPGSRPTVAVLGYAKGNHSFGGNFVGYSNGATDVTIGVEIDAGNLSGAGGTATNLLLRSLGGNIGGSGVNAYLQMQAAASSSAATGILFNNSGGVPAVASTGALIKAAAEITANGMTFSGSQFTTASINVPVNSGSTTASVGLILSAEGGFANAGEFLRIVAGATSTAANGIVFRLSGTTSPVTGSLIKTVGTIVAAIGIDFSSAAFSTAAIALGDSGGISFGTTTGGKIGTNATQKLSFWGAGPVVQPASTGTATGFTAGAGTTVTDQSTFTGAVGSTAYRISDIVKALKQSGLMAA